MKKIIFKYTLIGLLCLFAFPKKAEAQKRSTMRVKRSKVVVQKRTRVRPVRARRVAHYRYRGMPRWGKTVRTVGVGYIGIRFGGIGYRFHRGIWYRPFGKKYRVTRAPFGIGVRVLPVGYRKLVVGTNTYFYYYGTYYEKYIDSEEYIVVKAPIGAKVDALPEGYEIVKISDMEYYKFEYTYYERRINQNDEEYYLVVERPINED